MATIYPLLRVIQGGIAGDGIADPFGPRPRLHVAGTPRQRTRRGFCGVIREFQHRARVVHFCDECTHDIRPDDLYGGTVIIDPGAKSTVLTIKHHVDPPCPLDSLWQEEEDLLADRFEAEETLSASA